MFDFEINTFLDVTDLNARRKDDMDCEYFATYLNNKMQKFRRVKELSKSLLMASPCKAIV